MDTTRQQVLGFRVRAQELDRDHGTDAAILDLGVQDTGPVGAGWALAIRGVPANSAPAVFAAWTLRGAPHVYRRSEAEQVAAATRPLSSADAAKRVFDAAKALKAAGLDVLEALDDVAAQLEDIVSTPMVKGEVSSALTARMDEPFRRFCRPCDAVHLYEQTFRLAALQAGLALQPGTSPPVLERLPGWPGLPASFGSGDAQDGRGLPRRPRQRRDVALA